MGTPTKGSFNDQLRDDAKRREQEKANQEAAAKAAAERELKLAEEPQRRRENFKLVVESIVKQIEEARTAGTIQEGEYEVAPTNHFHPDDLEVIIKGVWSVLLRLEDGLLNVLTLNRSLGLRDSRRAPENHIQYSFLLNNSDNWVWKYYEDVTPRSANIIMMPAFGASNPDLSNEELVEQIFAKILEKGRQ